MHKHLHLSQHDEEHHIWNRRSFLQALGFAGVGTMTLSNQVISASSPSKLSQAIAESETDRVLVIVRLKGGNDGLNTIVPLNYYDTYANFRPTLRIPQNSLLKLSDDYGLPSYMQGAKNLWDQGKMKVVHGVGYKDNSKSHFQGSDNWATTDTVNERENTGWAARYFENLYPDYLFDLPDSPAAIQIGNRGNLIFEGDSTNYALSVASPSRLYQIASKGSLYSMENLSDCTFGDRSAFLRGIANSTVSYAEIINKSFEESKNSVSYENNGLSDQLSIIARLIKGNLGTKIYMAEIGGFDTHGGQQPRHQQIITELSDAMNNFYQDLQEDGWDGRVLSMTISEFGRRINENGSKGTDHGEASGMMLFGPALGGNGFIGDHPDLDNLDERDHIDFTTDFRQVYGSIMSQWLCVDSNLVQNALLGESFENLPLGFSCDSVVETGTEEILAEESFSHMALYNENQVSLRYVTPRDMHVDIRIYDIAGQHLGILENKFATQGENIVNINNTMPGIMSQGHYIYRISTLNGNYSKMFIMP